MMRQEFVEICLSFPFESAHYMPNFPEGHPNRKMHGHSYIAELSFRGPIDPNTGVFLEYSDLKKVGDEIISNLDHRVLNEISELELPTSENICRYIWKQFQKKLPGLYSIMLHRPTLGLKIRYFGPEG